MSAPVNASPLAVLAAELAARVGPSRQEALRLASAIGYSVRGVTCVLRGESRPSERLVDLIADEVGAHPGDRARWHALRVASLPPATETLPPSPEEPILVRAAPLRSHALRAASARRARQVLVRKLRAVRKEQLGLCASCSKPATHGDTCERHIRAPKQGPRRPPGRPRLPRGDAWARRYTEGREELAQIAASSGVQVEAVRSALRVRGVYVPHSRRAA